MACVGQLACYCQTVVFGSDVMEREFLVEGNMIEWKMLKDLCTWKQCDMRIQLDTA